MTHRFSPRPRIVIVGGGTAGLLLATRGNHPPAKPGAFGM